jgi:hypothetical protein
LQELSLDLSQVPLTLLKILNHPPTIMLIIMWMKGVSTTLKLRENLLTGLDLVLCLIETMHENLLTDGAELIPFCLDSSKGRRIRHIRLDTSQELIESSQEIGDG